MEDNINKKINAHITEHLGSFMQRLLEWKSSKSYMFRVCVCSLRYTACYTRAPCYVVFGLSACTIFSTLSHTPHDFRKTCYWI